MKTLQEHVQRVRAIRAAVESELQRLDLLLTQLSDPELKRTIAMARRDVASIEADLLRHVAASPDPATLLGAAEHCLANAVASRKLVEEQRRDKQ